MYIPMSMTSCSRLFRQVARILAAVQLLAFAIAPLLEAVTVAKQTTATVSVDAAQHHGSTLNHDPSTCSACQLLRTVARLPELPRVAVVGEDAPAPTDSATDLVARLSPRQGFLSRAPPAFLA